MFQTESNSIAINSESKTGHFYHLNRLYTPFTAPVYTQIKIETRNEQFCDFCLLRLFCATSDGSSAETVCCQCQVATCHLPAKCQPHVHVPWFTCICAHRPSGFLADRTYAQGRFALQQFGVASAYGVGTSSFGGGGEFRMT